MKKASVFNGPHFVVSFEFSKHDVTHGDENHTFMDKNYELVALVPSGFLIVIEEKLSFWKVVKRFFK